MHSNHQLFALSQMWLALAVAAAVSIVYYLVPGPQTLMRRILASSHGILLLLAVGYAIAVSKWSTTSGIYQAPLWLLLILFMASVIYALFQYRGWRAAVHCLQVIQLPSALWILFVGSTTITHDWI